MLLYICNPSYEGGIGRRITVEANPGKKPETISEK
jgi:hypothetical protein